MWKHCWGTKISGGTLSRPYIAHTLLLLSSVPSVLKSNPPHTTKPTMFVGVCVTNPQDVRLTIMIQKKANGIHNFSSIGMELALFSQSVHEVPT